MKKAKLLLLTLLAWVLRPIADYAESVLVFRANHKGSEGVVHIGTSVIAELRSWELSESANAINDTVLTDAWETTQLGTKNWSGSASAFLDETDTNGQEALTIGATGTAKFYPEGTGTSATYKYGTILVTGVKSAAAINGMVEREFSFTGNGALTQTTA